MRDIFRNLACDALMKAFQDLEDEHALEWGPQQMTTIAASVGDLGVPSWGPEGNTEPLSEAKSQMQAFMKEVSAWILECKAWNAECKLARGNNSQAGAGIGNHAQRGDQNCINKQG